VHIQQAAQFPALNLAGNVVALRVQNLAGGRGLLVGGAARNRQAARNRVLAVPITSGDPPLIKTVTVPSAWFTTLTSTSSES